MLRFGIALGFVAVLLLPRPVQAHSASNAPSSNYVTKVVSVSATNGGTSTTGFRLRSIEAGSRLELRWLSGDEITVPDYDGNPYLRIGRNGVFENTQSNAVYLNRDRNGATRIPDGLDPQGTPTWRKVSTASVARWHDHRAHRMGGDPPGVQAHPGRRQLVQEETIEFSQGTATWNAAVRVSWVPGPSPALAYGIIALGTLALLAAGLWATKWRPGRVAPAVVLGLVILTCADAFHLAGIAFGIAGSTGAALGRMVSVGFASIAGWGVAIAAIALLTRRRVDGLYLATFAAGLMTLVGGLADLSVFSHSSVPFAFSAGAARVAVVVTLVLGIAIAVVSIVATRPLPTSPASASGELSTS
jgi:hypothetical protein